MSIKTYLFKPVDNSPLILFRIFFGLILTVEAWGAIGTGWVRRTFIEPHFTFTFIGMEWLQPLPGYGMYCYYALMGVAGLMVMFGYYYRWGIGLYTLLWSAAYFMQKTSYNNHYYLTVLLCILMLFMPAHRYAAYDVKRKPQLRGLTCPQWCISAFMLQIGIVYTYASVAKIYPDWLAAVPVSLWFSAKSAYPVIGPLLAQDWMPWLISYGGILFDGLIAPALLWKKTRKTAFFLAIFFHLFNSVVFQVGVFPYLGILLCVFFFDPEVIRRTFFHNQRLERIYKFFKNKACLLEKPQVVFGENAPAHREKKAYILIVLSLWFLIQVGLPLRHWYYEGDVNWTEEGHRLSWRMMLRSKWGYVNFRVKDPGTGEVWTVDKGDFLSEKQQRVIATRPDMCWQFVQVLKDSYQKEGKKEVEIYAQGEVSLNGHGSRPLYNPDVNLAKIEWVRFSHSDWLLPERE